MTGRRQPEGELRSTWIVQKAGLRWAVVRRMRFTSAIRGWTHDRTVRKFWTRSAAEDYCTRVNAHRKAAAGKSFAEQIDMLLGIKP